MTCTSGGTHQYNDHGECVKCGQLSLPFGCHTCGADTVLDPGGGYWCPEHGYAGHPPTVCPLCNTAVDRQVGAYSVPLSLVHVREDVECRTNES